MLDSCDGGGVAETPGYKLKFMDLVHLLAAAEFLQTPMFLAERICGFMRRALINLPLRHFKKFLRHSARDHPARSLVVNSVSNIYSSNSLLEAEMYLECAKLYDREMYRDLQSAIHEKQDLVADEKSRQGEVVSGDSGTAAHGAGGDDRDEGMSEGSGSGSSTITALLSPGDEDWNPGVMEFLSTSNLDNGSGDRYASDKENSPDVDLQGKKPMSARPCHQCGHLNHFARNCWLSTCCKCNKPGHFAKTCTASFRSNASGNASSDQNVCHRCNEMGHYASHCTKIKTCYNCGEPGHISRDCTKPREDSRKPADVYRPASTGSNDRWESKNNRRAGGGEAGGRGHGTSRTDNSGWDDAGPSSTVTATSPDRRRGARNCEGDEEDGSESTEQIVTLQLEKKRGGKNGRRAYYDLTPYVL